MASATLADDFGDCLRASCDGLSPQSAPRAPRAANLPAANGKTDDYAAIQSEIDRANAAGGGTVWLPAGTYLINGHLRMRSNVTLEGAGKRTVLKAGPHFLDTTGPLGGYPLITTLGANNVRIASLTADQSGDTLNANVPGRLTEYLIDVRRSRHVIVDGVFTTNPFSYSIAVVGSSQFKVEHCHTQVTTSGRYNQLDGIHILNSFDGEVTQNTVDQGKGADGDDGLVAHTIRGSTHDIAYTENVVRGGPHGSAMQFAYGAPTDAIYDITVQKNFFWGSRKGVRTGAYGGPGGTVSHVTIGGSDATGNCFSHNRGDAVHLEGSLRDITVTYNQAQKSGGFVVGEGNHILVANNGGGAMPCMAIRHASGSPKDRPRSGRESRD